MTTVAHAPKKGYRTIRLPLAEPEYDRFLTNRAYAKGVWLFCHDASNPSCSVSSLALSVIRIFLQRQFAVVAEPWASLRIWPGDCVDTPVFRGSPSTHRNRH
jgi:hypothetical protein